MVGHKAVNVSTDLDDLSITTPENNQVLAWSTSLSKWINQTPGAGSTNIKQTEVDWGGDLYQTLKIFTITDADVSPTSQLIALTAYEAPTGKALDELELDSFELKCKPNAGSFDVMIKSLEGSFVGPLKINYLIG